MIIGVNVLFFLAVSLFPSLYAYLGLSVISCVGYHFWWQPVTYMFVHAGFSHILLNMLGILMFGLAVERAIGSKEFLLFYFMGCPYPVGYRDVQRCEDESVCTELVADGVAV